MNVVDARTIAKYSAQLETTVGRLPASVTGALLTLDPDPGILYSRHHLGGRDSAYQYFTAMALSGLLLTVVTGRAAAGSRWEYRMMSDPDEARVTGHRFRVDEVAAVGLEQLVRHRATSSAEARSITTEGVWVLTMRDGTRHELSEFDHVTNATGPAEFCRGLLAAMRVR